jgi:hypothetical protein
MSAAPGHMQVNVGDGFLPSFAPEFVERFGGVESEFVRALSDVLTRAVALLMERAGQLHDPKAVKYFSDTTAADMLQELYMAVAERGVFLSEAIGSAPAGAIEQAVDTAIVSRTFSTWLRAFEAGDYSTCLKVLQVRT